MESVNKNPLKHFSIPSAEDLGPKPRERTATPVVKSGSVEAIGCPSDVLPKSEPREKSSSVAPAAAEISTPEVKPSVVPQSVKFESPTDVTQPPDLAAVDGATVADGSPFASVLKAVEDAYDALISTKNGVKPNSLLNKIYFTYRFPVYKDGTSGCHKVPVREIVQYNAAALLQSLDKSKYGAHEFWSYLQELSEAEFCPISYKLSDFPITLVPRKSMPRQPMSDVLQPPAGPSVKNEDDDSSPVPRGKTLKPPGHKPGKKSSLRPVVPPKKRPHSEFESESESEASGFKNSHYFSDGDDVMEDAPEVETPRDGEAITNSQPATPGEEPIKILIRAEKIPSTVPQGPDDAWTCDQDGCNYIVRGGDDDECQARIREHFHDHEQEIERVSLAVTESRGHLPIKYAYFPPFLIQVQFSPHTPSSPAAAAAAAPRRTRRRIANAPPSPDNHAAAVALASPPASAGACDPPPDLSGSAIDAFRDIVQQFRRERHPVSDRIHNLTRLQSFAPEDQAHGREGAGPPRPPADGERHGDIAAGQAESDSVTLVGDD